MTAFPKPPNHPLTIDEYAALDETESGYAELQEGRLLMSPSPTPDHMWASKHLAQQLDRQLPDDLAVLQDIDIDLELVPRGQPGSARRPDLIIFEPAARKRVRAEGGLIRASEVLVVVEIVSPSSWRTDNVTKRALYADAGIPRYWIIDIEEPVSLVDCHLTEHFGYQDHACVTGTFTTTTPFPLRIDLDQLR
jgi:Uma2 family endonuclease